jgi:hypothetical protein
MIERRADVNSSFYTYLSLTFFPAASIFLMKYGIIKLWRRDPKTLPTESVPNFLIVDKCLKKWSSVSPPTPLFNFFHLRGDD